MSTENRPSQPRREQAWNPTKEFLLSEPRSAEIREVCVGIVRRLDALLHDPEVAGSQDRQSQLYAELEMQGGHLIELGIKPGLHVGKPLEAFQSSPVTMAEYVAGQLIEQTGANVVSESAAMPIIQEMSEAQSGSAHLISGKNITPKLRDFMVMRSIVNVGYRFLDAEPEDKPE
ncbi:MAG TPA: hypothetical protein VJ327_08490 [Patescibacteria group bacterium]|nr:hypothetical protein [Patescibacteria group bacterium]